MGPCALCLCPGFPDPPPGGWVGPRPVTRPGFCGAPVLAMPGQAPSSLMAVLARGGPGTRCSADQEVLFLVRVMTPLWGRDVGL